MRLLWVEHINHQSQVYYNLISYLVHILHIFITVNKINTTIKMYYKTMEFCVMCVCVCKLQVQQSECNNPYLNIKIYIKKHFKTFFRRNLTSYLLRCSWVGGFLVGSWCLLSPAPYCPHTSSVQWSRGTAGFCTDPAHHTQGQKPPRWGSPQDCAADRLGAAHSGSWGVLEKE